MAGLVDYGVDSEDDIIHGNSPKSTKVTTPPVCDDLNSDTEKPSSKTSKTKSEECESALFRQKPHLSLCRY